MRDALNEPRTGKKIGDKCDDIKCVVKTIFKWDVMDRLRCKPYTDKTFILVARTLLYINLNVSLCHNKTRYSFNLRLACMIF